MGFLHRVVAQKNWCPLPVENTGDGKKSWLCVFSTAKHLIDFGERHYSGARLAAGEHGLGGLLCGRGDQGKGCSPLGKVMCLDK